MNARRVWILGRRIIQQIVRDRRMIALLVFIPILVLTLGALLFRAKPAAIPLGVVNEDQGQSLPSGIKISLGAYVTQELGRSGTFAVTPLSREEVDARLRDGTVQGVLIIPESFSADLHQKQQATLPLRLEGSNPTRSMQIAARVSEAAMKALAGLVTSLGMGTPGAPPVPLGAGKLPVAIEPSFLYGGAKFDTMDYIAPVYVAFLVMFFVFVLTCVSFLRERSLGTMERLLATPANRLEIVLGYMMGLGLFALIQATVIISFTVWILKIHYLGSLVLLFLVVVVLAVVAVSTGILASTFARNEFQVVQFIPLLIVPQGLLSGTFWAVEEMPAYLRPFAYAMPLTYANRALRDVMLKGWGLTQIWPNLLILLGFAVSIIALGALVMRREVA